MLPIQKVFLQREILQNQSRSKDGGGNGLIANCLYGQSEDWASFDALYIKARDPYQNEIFTWSFPLKGPDEILGPQSQPETEYGWDSEPVLISLTFDFRK